MSGTHGKMLFLSVNHDRWLLPSVLMTQCLYNDEKKKGFLKDPNGSGSSDAAAWRKYTSNEPQRTISAQQEENYSVIPTFNIISIFIALLAGQEQAYYIVSSQKALNLISLRKGEFKSTHIIAWYYSLRFVSKISHKASRYYSAFQILILCAYLEQNLVMH